MLTGGSRTICMTQLMFFRLLHLVLFIDGDPDTC